MGSGNEVWEWGIKLPYTECERGQELRKELSSVEQTHGSVPGPVDHAHCLPP